MIGIIRNGWFFRIDNGNAKRQGGHILQIVSPCSVATAHVNDA
jgi:hypothetical protein